MRQTYDPGRSGPHAMIPSGFEGRQYACTDCNVIHIYLKHVWTDVAKVRKLARIEPVEHYATPDDAASDFARMMERRR